VSKGLNATAMGDRSKILVLGALILLFVALTTLDVSVFPLSLGGHRLLPWLVLGIIVLFLMRSGCCGGSSCKSPEETDQDQ